ncbi:MAG TPA: DUF6036 family nucleotidyltransferase [Xanthobacteraceae bacterium]|nr:DUF6036 family nucleotidyltransferase [Xanthobacteraceae bacterium]
MTAGSLRRTIEDVERTVRAIATEFDTDTVVIIGSQAILLGWPDPPPVLRHSPEIDAFPGCTTIWEAREKARFPDETPDASEHINALFGDGSQFHETHGFYIDGVDKNTAVLPKDWRTRAIVRRIEVDKLETGKVVKRMVTAIAPSPEDVIVAKLARLEEKDRSFVQAFHSARPLDAGLIEARIRSTKMDPAVAERAIAYVRTLARDVGYDCGGDPAGRGKGCA